MKKNKILIGAGTALAVASFGSFAALSDSRLAGSEAAPAAITSHIDTKTQNQDVSLEERDEAFESFEATAYCDFGITYSGVWVQRGIVAADPSVLPIGSVLEVKAGDYSGIYTVMDTGGVVKGRIIDIYVPDYEEAIQFGRQQVQVKVLRHGWHPDAVETFEYTLAG